METHSVLRLDHLRKLRKMRQLELLFSKKFTCVVVENYSNIITKNPELSFIEAVNKETGGIEEISKYKVGKLEVELQETISDLELYSPKKMMVKKLI